MSSSTITSETTSASKPDRTATSPAIQVQPYLFFGGRCEAALDYYRRVLGAEVTMLMRFKDSPDPASRGAASGDMVMHASLRVGETTILASDGCGDGQPKFEGFSLSLTQPNDAAAERVFAALADGGKVQQPLAQTFFASRFGMVEDRFGVGWMVMVPASLATEK